MDEKNRAIPRNALTDFCKALGYDPREVLTIEATSQTVAVTTLPTDVAGIEGVTTVHQITDAEVQA